jgi:8-oxo-dGTP pyrophosphatase MutT (NUDIX family)
MNGPSKAAIRTRMVASIARIPWANALAKAVARTIAGSHHVGAIAIVLSDDVDERGETPVVLLARHTFHGDRWRLPGGWVRRGEHPEAACEREVLEETGVEVRAVELLGCDLHTNDGVPLPYSGLTLAFRCTPVDPVTRPTARSIELADVDWFTIAEATATVRGFERSMIEGAMQSIRPPVNDRAAEPGPGPSGD